MRSLIASDVALISARDIKLHYLVEAKFPEDVGGDLLLCTAPFNLPYGGRSWIGTGQMLALEPAQEDSTLEIHAATLTLNGLDATLLSLVLNENLNGIPVLVYWAFFDVDTNQPTGPAVLFQRGVIGEITIIAASSDEGGQ